MKKLLWGFTFIFIFLPNVSSAIPITDGFIYAHGGLATPRIFSFSGPNFHVSGTFVRGPITGGDSFTSRREFSINAWLGPGDFGPGYYTSGVESLKVGWGFFDATGPNDFRITGPPIEIDAGGGVYTGSFSFSGSLCGSPLVPFYQGPRPCDVRIPSLEGVGTVRAVLYEQPVSFDSPQAYSVREITYTFTNPIPEPSTMILLCTGIAGLAGWRRRRRRKNL